MWNDDFEAEDPRTRVWRVASDEVDPASDARIASTVADGSFYRHALRIREEIWKLLRRI